MDIRQCAPDGTTQTIMSKADEKAAVNSDASLDVSLYAYVDVRAAANGMSPQFENDFFSPFRNSSFFKLTFSFENIFRSRTF